MKNLKTLAIVALAFLLIGAVAGYELPGMVFSRKISPEEAKVKVQSFLDENGISYEIGTIEEYDTDLYKVELSSTQGKFFAYLSKSGNSLFQGVFELNKEKTEETKTENKPAEVVKSQKPVVELFVMSHCPYGTQIEKGILPVLDALKNKIDFQLKYVNYAMHGQKEIDEQLNQYCINKLYPEKFNSYLSCFLADENGSAGCVQSQGISASNITSCVTETDKQFNISADYADKSTWKGSYPSFGIYNEDNEKYNVAGSPTLVINGVTSNAGRSPSSLLEAICASFETSPEECKTQLSTDNPAPGFGSGSAGSASDASCN
ncbi:MAG: hypothetical protein WC243_04015 [Patescibacteria group bacterium]|jgi:hypothetical protein